jgi:hypothetical protein
MSRVFESGAKRILNYPRAANVGTSLIQRRIFEQRLFKGIRSNVITSRAVRLLPLGR